ncbi:FGGY-family carbohydrate kinase [Actinoallomurus iriomotensis]|uniref:Xylulokinase n=1 Tax=Actinoallomurus iriomotensis TaxID=478107 RepID=A0A9W6RRQ9_9ACTN|nr:FGGY family carbohydrate kinase [Actinoallomurus iriomotensis]GLY78957.1 xylulokinase [Actinoallomurus iriomotensis]
MSTLAGLDIGTTHTKVALYRADGTSLVSRRDRTPGDADALRTTALRLLAECVAEAGTAPAAVGVGSMAETGVPLDEGGDPAGPLLDWRDRSAADEAGVLASEVGSEAFFAVTGLRPGAKLPLARWMRLRRHAPDVLRRMACWVSAADLVAASLTGVVATSPTLASRTGAYDIHQGAYRPDLLDLAGLSPDRLPPVVTGVAGRVGTAAAGRTGLLAGTPVVVAGHDHMAAAWAAGVRAPGRVADSMGTAEAIVTPVAAVPARVVDGATVGPFVDGASYCLISGLPASGGLVEWLLGRIAPAGHPDPHRWFTELVGPPEAPPTGITVLPYLRGRAAPEPDPRRTLSMHGLRPEHTLADLGRAVLEGLSMQARWMLDTAGGGVRPGSVTVFGGPAANPTWMWIKARLTPAPLAVVPGAHGAALGAAQLAGRAIGLPDGFVPAPPRAPVPAPEWEEAYRSRFLPLATAPSPSDEQEAP